MNSRIVSAAAFGSVLLAGSMAFAEFTLGAGFLPDPMTGTGISGGDTDASEAGPGCVGAVAAEPDHTLTVTSTVSLSVYVISPGTDTTLVILGTDGTAYCDDDSHGDLQPQVDAVLEPGTYYIHVGAIGDAGEYTIYLTENL
jgi:hypothetical protein